MSRDPGCIFCRIIRGEIPAAVVLQTDSVIAFLDIAPVAPGHLLLVPRQHYATLADAPPEVARALASELPRLARALQSATGAPGLGVVQNNGRVAGQEVDHLHFHLIPRREGDQLRVHWPRSNYQGDAAEQMRAKIANLVSGE